IRQFETYVESGNRASMRILFVKEHQRSNFPYLLKSRLISKAFELGGGSWSVYGVGDGFSNDVKEQAGMVQIKVLGYNYEELQSLAAAMKDSLLEYRRIQEVTIDSKFSWYKSDYMEYFFHLNKQELVQKNLVSGELFNYLNPMFERGGYAGDWINEGRIEPIRLYSLQTRKLDIWNMENYPGMIGEKGYKLSEVAVIGKDQAPQDIAKEDQQYRLCLQYGYIGSYQQSWNVQERVIESFNKTAPLGYKAESDSSRYWWSQGVSSQYWLLFIIMVIVFFMTGILFNSFKQPLVILFIIPISFIGIFLTFYLFDLNFDQEGFAAFILLAGIAINANIYILSEYNNIKEAYPGMAPVKVYIKAWNAKIRPIFLTIISTVLGFIPFIVGQYKEGFWFPLAAGTIGGLVLSLIALFFFLPLFMGVGRRKTSGKSRKSANLLT
ncbi:MAG: efflux RND transporter permease subunit, partial [Bacteroides sp.]|nr:efflux RND transporter permease subunit [Bacteroides sp.]